MARNKGIDYGCGTMNIDNETGIRFGVISMHDVGEAWYESSEADYDNASCPKCGNEVVDYDGDARDEYDQFTHAEWNGYTNCVCCDKVCENCEIILDNGDCFGEQPLAHVLDDGEYKATQGGDDCDIFVLSSPYFTRAAFCSPCAPGACYLSSPCDDGERAFCFGHDFFEGNIAPYSVYSVATGELIEP